MPDHRLERLRDQAEKLEQVRGISHEVTLLKLYVLEPLERGDDLDELEVRLAEVIAKRP